MESTARDQVVRSVAMSLLTDTENCLMPTQAEDGTWHSMANSANLASYDEIQWFSCAAPAKKTKKSRPWGGIKTESVAISVKEDEQEDTPSLNGPSSHDAVGNGLLPIPSLITDAPCTPNSEDPQGYVAVAANFADKNHMQDEADRALHVMGSGATLEKGDEPPPLEREVDPFSTSDEDGNIREKVKEHLATIACDILSTTETGCRARSLDAHDDHSSSLIAKHEPSGRLDTALASPSCQKKEEPTSDSLEDLPACHPDVAQESLKTDAADMQPTQSSESACFETRSTGSKPPHTKNDRMIEGNILGSITVPIAFKSEETELPRIDGILPGLPNQQQLLSETFAQGREKRGWIAKTPREAVGDAAHHYMRSRRAKERKAAEKEAEKKRKAEIVLVETTQKAPRLSRDNDATAAAHSQVWPTGDSANAGGLAEHQDEVGNAQTQQEWRSIEDIEDPEDSYVLDFDVKRGVSNTRITSPKTIKKFFGEGNAEITPDGKSLIIKNMVSPLWQEQAIAVHWMMIQEEMPIGVRGGILGAAMGTGKTVMSLGVITGNPRLEEDSHEYSRATLVVVPNQKVARQWKDKIDEHCTKEFAGKCILSKSKDPRAPNYYGNSNIVVATYHEVCKQLPKSAARRAIDENWNDPVWRRRTEKTPNPSAFFYTKWYRVILDEAHKISNKETETFKSCRRLRAKYRWCVSGTPLSNSVEELFPYLTFLACDFAKSISTFYDKFKWEPENTDEKEKKQKQLDALMKMLVYKLNIEKVGKKIESNGQTDINVPLSAEESLIFNVVKPIMSKKPSKLMRKRQAVSHFFNLERMFLLEFSASELQSLLDELAGLEGRKSVLQVLLDLSKEHPLRTIYAKGFQRLQDISCDMMTGHFRFEPLLQTLKYDREIGRKRCVECEEKPDPWTWVESRNCEHLFCNSCLKPSSVYGGKCPHPDCEAHVAYGRAHPTLDYLSLAASKRDFLRKGKDIHGTRLVKPSTECPAHLLTDLDMIPIPPSTKLVMAAAIIFTWRAEHPGDKIVVFLDLLTTAKVLGTMLQKAGESFLYMFGNLGDNKSQTALDKFKSSTGVPILLASLRSCSEALNITEANRVMTVDPWWNNTREQQAFGRVHRIGQKKMTYFVRLISDGDQRIMELQRRKLREITSATGEDGHKQKNLPKGEYNELFAVDTAFEEELKEEGSQSESEADERTQDQFCQSATSQPVELDSVIKSSEEEAKPEVRNLMQLQQALCSSEDGLKKMQLEEEDLAHKSDGSDPRHCAIADTGYGEQDAVMIG